MTENTDIGDMDFEDTDDAETADETTVVSMVRERADDVRGSAGAILVDVGQRTSVALDEAITTADGKRSSLQAYVDSLSQGALEVFSIVLNIVENYVEENDLNVTVSDHQIHIEGDEDGIKKIETELRKAALLQNRDVDITYEREEGLDITFSERSIDET